MGRAEEALAKPGTIIHIEDVFHVCALKAFRESRQEGRVGRYAAHTVRLARFSKEVAQIDPNFDAFRTFCMEQSASPLLVFMIASIVVLAVGVHAVFAGDPFYGSNLDLVAPTVFSPDI